MPPESESRTLKAFSVEVTIMARIVVLAAGLALALQAVALTHEGQMYRGLEMAGISIVVLVGSFDPINTLWLFLPFTWRPVAVPATNRFKVLRGIMGLVGLMLFISGLVARR
jgi:hypothetical protein